MSVSVHIVGVRDMDHTFKKMLKVKHACDGADIPYPKEVNEYFGELLDYEEKYFEEHMRDIEITYAGNPERGEGAVVELKGLPEECKAIRVYMS